MTDAMPITTPTTVSADRSLCARSPERDADALAGVHQCSPPETSSTDWMWPSSTWTIRSARSATWRSWVTSRTYCPPHGGHRTGRVSVHRCPCRRWRWAHRRESTPGRSTAHGRWRPAALAAAEFRGDVVGAVAESNLERSDLARSRRRARSQPSKTSGRATISTAESRGMRLNVWKTNPTSVPRMSARSVSLAPKRPVR